MKERLTGAIILVVLIVLLVPELLSGPSRSASAQQPAGVPASQEPPLRSYTIDLADESHSAGSTGAATSPASQASVPTLPPAIVETPPAPASQAASSDASTSADPAPTQDGPARNGTENVQQGDSPSGAASRQRPTGKPQDARPSRVAQAPPAQRPEASPNGDWMVQLGVFAKHENADRLVQELKGHGYRALVTESTGGGRALWRVRVGPIAERATAEQLSARLRAAGHAGSVVPR